MEAALVLSQEQLNEIDAQLEKIRAVPEVDKAGEAIYRVLHNEPSKDNTGKAMGKVAPAQLHSGLATPAWNDRNIVLIPKQVCYVVDSSNTLGNALCGKRFMSRFRELARQTWFKVLVAITYVCGPTALLLCFFSGLKDFGWIATFGSFICFSLSLHLRLDLIRKLICKFNQLFLIGNLVVLALCMAILSKWDLSRSIGTLVSVPLYCLPGIFHDAMPDSIRNSGSSVDASASILFLLLIVGLRVGIFDLEEDVILSFGRIDFSVKERCVSCAFNLSVLYLSNYISKQSSKGEITGIDVPLVRKKVTCSTKGKS